MGCNCYGCCSDALPPPSSPPQPPPPDAPPPAATPALSPTSDGGVDLCGELGAGTTALLEASVAYSLTCPLNVTAGATLVIEAGTTVSVASGAAAIVVQRGGQLRAEGRAHGPITFDGSATAAAGWGGLLVMGAAPVPVTGLALPTSDYGGDAPDDSSGVLRYVRIWHARTGLALWGVGNGTLIDHCEVAFSRGDSFDFRGGTADVRAISSLFAAGAAFHAAAGYRGRGQFLFAALGANGTAGVAVDAEPSASPAEQTQPLFYSLTVLGGGAAGRPDSALVRFGDGVGGALGNAVLAHSRGTALESGDAASQLPMQHRPPPPPTPSPPAGYSAAVLLPNAECGRQLSSPTGETVGDVHLGPISQGLPAPPLSLGLHASADSCALAAGSYFDAFGNCSTFQWSLAFPDVWDCICCVQAGGGRFNRLWSVYALAAAPPPLPSLPPLPKAPPEPATPPPPALPPSAPALAISSALYMAGANLVHAVGSSSAGVATLIAALVAREADPGLVSVDAGCLFSECMLSSSAHFDPRPAADGAACASEPEDATALDGGRFFSQTACSGAFASAHYERNWLDGWSLLFPRALGTGPDSAIQLPDLTLADGVLVSTTLHFTPNASGAFATVPLAVDGLADARRRQLVRADDVTSLDETATLVTHVEVDETRPSRRRRVQAGASSCGSVTAASFDALRDRCAGTAFSGVGAAVWVRLRPPPGEVQLSTCTRGGAGFDTDLAVFKLTGQGGGGDGGGGGGYDGCALEPVGCNGDGFGEEGCQPLYSRLSFGASEGATYLVAVSGYDGVVGANVTLSVEALRPPAPPRAPPPLAPPPPPLNGAWLQGLIDRSLDDARVPFVLSLDADVQLVETIVIRAPKSVVVRGSSALNQTVISGQQLRRAFDVHDGARLHLANVAIEDAHAPDACGGAVLLRGAGVLVAQHVAFVRNEASRGGAICAEGHADLTLVAVRMESNEAAVEGHDLYLGRPTAARAPLVELRGLTLSGHAAGDVARYGAWASSSCPPVVTSAAATAQEATECLFHRVATAPAADYRADALYAACTPSLTHVHATNASGVTALSSRAVGVECECEAGTSLQPGLTLEQRALAPYGLSPVDDLLARAPGTAPFEAPRCRRHLEAPFRPAGFVDHSAQVVLSKRLAVAEHQALNITLPVAFIDPLDGQAATWRVYADEAATFNLSACTLGLAGRDDPRATCTVAADGSVAIDNDGITGWPLQVLASSRRPLMTLPIPREHHSAPRSMTIRGSARSPFEDPLDAPPDLPPLHGR